MKKYIVWDREDKTKPEICEDFETDNLRDYRLSVPKLIFNLIFKRRKIAWMLEGCIKYALAHADSLRGTYASDVVMFQNFANDVWVKRVKR